jgi:DNA replication and repair protein RecF
VTGTARRRHGERKIRLILYEGDKRLFLDGQPLDRLAELFGELNAVLFTPGDLGIVQGGPSLRRRFLDLELCQVSRPYLEALQRYTLGLRQRNALLRSGQSLDRLAPSLEAYEGPMAEAAADILAARREALDDLARRAAEAYSSFGAGEKLEIRYEHFLRQEKGEPHEAGAFRKRLEDDRKEDLRIGSTRCGPHRDDFRISLDGHNAHDYASQGQQRSVALALRIAEVGLMAERTGDRPVLLLDDLASELDSGRRQRLLEMLHGGGQVFMTTTRPSDFPDDMGFAASWKVSQGELEKD